MGGQAGNRQEVTRKRERPLVPKVLGIIFLIAVIWLSGMQVWQWLLSLFVDIKPLQEDTLVQKVPAGAILIKNEIPVKALISGRVEMIAGDGDRLRLGAPVARIKGIKNNVTVYSPRAGLLCTHVDGLEGTLRPENIGVLDIGSIEKIETANEIQPDKVRKVEKGFPFCKLVDNLEPLIMYLWLEEESNAGKLKRRERVDLLWEGERISGSLLELRGNNGKGLLLKIYRYPEQILHHRKVKVQVIVKELEGYPVPRETLVFRGTQAGIYVIEKQLVTWTPVKIKGHLNGKVILEGNGLSENTRYVTNPGRVKQGARVE